MHLLLLDLWLYGGDNTAFYQQSQINFTIKGDYSTNIHEMDSGSGLKIVLIKPNGKTLEL